MTLDEIPDGLSPAQAYDLGYRRGFHDGECSVRQWWPVEGPLPPGSNCRPRGLSPRAYPQTGGASNRAGGAR